MRTALYSQVGVSCEISKELLDPSRSISSEEAENPLDAQKGASTPKLVKGQSKGGDGRGL